MKKQIAKTAKKKPATKTHTPTPEFSPERVIAQYLLESNRFDDEMRELAEHIAFHVVKQFPEVKTQTQRQLGDLDNWFYTALWDDIEYTADQLIRATMRNVMSEKLVPRVRLECPYEFPTKGRRS